MKINQTECLGHSVILVSLRGPPGDITEQGQERSRPRKAELTIVGNLDIAVCAKYWTFGKNVMRE